MICQWLCSYTAEYVTIAPTIGSGAGRVTTKPKPTATSVTSRSSGGGTTASGGGTTASGGGTTAPTGGSGGTTPLNSGNY